MGGEKLLGVVAIHRQATIKTEFRADRRHLPQVAKLHRSHWPAQETVFPPLHAQPATDPRGQQPHGSSPYLTHLAFTGSAFFHPHREQRGRRPDTLTADRGQVLIKLALRRIHRPNSRPPHANYCVVQDNTSPAPPASSHTLLGSFPECVLSRQAVAVVNLL